MSPSPKGVRPASHRPQINETTSTKRHGRRMCPAATARREYRRLGRLVTACLLGALLLSSAACERRSDDAATGEPIATATPSGDVSPAEIATAVAIAEAFDDSDTAGMAALDARGLDIDAFEELMREIAASPQATERFRAARISGD